MHIILGAIALLGAAMMWYWRAKQAREAGGELLDAANDIRLAARRLMYKRKHKTHPADSVDDARLAASGIVVAVATMDNPISQAEIDKLTVMCQSTFKASHAEAVDIVSFGRWVAGQCNTNAEAVRRLAKVIQKTAGPEAAPDLVRMIEEVCTVDGNSLGTDENDALDTIRRTLKIA